MKLRKGVVPLILFALIATAAAYVMFGNSDPVPMENGGSIFD